MATLLQALDTVAQEHLAHFAQGSASRIPSRVPSQNETPDNHALSLAECGNLIDVENKSIGAGAGFFDAQQAGGVNVLNDERLRNRSEFRNLQCCLPSRVSASLSGDDTQQNASSAKVGISPLHYDSAHGERAVNAELVRA